MKKYYFGYGSNLNLAEAETKGVTQNMLVPYKKVRLPDERLVFNFYSPSRDCGALNIEPAKGNYVEGYLFEVQSEDGWRALDHKEGHPNYYCREKVTVLDEDCQEIEALTYRVVPERISNFLAPNEEYLDICRQGRIRFGLLTEELELAARNIKPKKCNAIFVYGTLMTGEIREAAWDKIKIETRRTDYMYGTLYDYESYPGMVLNTQGVIKGELVRTENIETALPIFDQIEGFESFGRKDNLFRRSLAKPLIGDEHCNLAWVYLTNRTSVQKIRPLYDWRNKKTWG